LLTEYFMISTLKFDFESNVIMFNNALVMRSNIFDPKEARQALVSLLYYVYCFEGKESMIHVYAKRPQCSMYKP